MQLFQSTHRTPFHFHQIVLRVTENFQSTIKHMQILKTEVAYFLNHVYHLRI